MPRRNKAVADGCISYFIDHFVTTRVARYAYGTDCDVLYDRDNIEHHQRASSAYVSLEGDFWIRNTFDVILPKVSIFLLFPSSPAEFNISFLRTPKSQRLRSSTGLIG